MGFFADILKRRALRPVIKQLPHILKQRYGAGRHYTAGQVAASIAGLKIKTGFQPFAFAMACTTDECARAEPAVDSDKRSDLRDELARLFWLNEADLHCKKLCQTYKAQVNAPSGINIMCGPSFGGTDSGSGLSSGGNE